MSSDPTEIEPDVPAYGILPAPDVEEFAIGAADVDVSSIGGYPVRIVEIVAGSGTLKIQTARSGTTYRTLTVATGDQIVPTQITSIGGTTAGTSGVTTVRVYK